MADATVHPPRSPTASLLLRLVPSALAHELLAFLDEDDILSLGSAHLDCDLSRCCAALRPLLLRRRAFLSTVGLLFLSSCEVGRLGFAAASIKVWERYGRAIRAEVGRAKANLTAALRGRALAEAESAAKQLSLVVKEALRADALNCKPAI